MNPAMILLVIQAIQAAISAAPQVAAIVTKGKDFITSLFDAKLITAEQQATIHAHLDTTAALVASGIVPAHWLVQPDPTA